MSLADQTLPAGENFEKPDWTAKTIGSALDNCPPFYFWLNSWNLSNSLLASDGEYASCPFKTGGALECANFGVLYSPIDGGDLPAHMTDKTGSGDQTKIRGLIAREEDTFNRDDLSFEASFGLNIVGGAIIGRSTQGTSGSSPQPGASRSFPTVDSIGSTDLDNTTLIFNPEGNTPGSLITGTAISRPGGTGSGAVTPWLGCAVAIRVGGGRPLLVASDGSPTSSSEWSFRRVNGYVFAAYPVVNGAATDLYLEMWRFTTNASDEQIPRLMAKQVVPAGATSWLHDQPYEMRVEVDNVGANPTLEGYISKYSQGGTSGEKQCFKDGVFTTSTITAGPSGDGAVVTATGVITDSGTDKIAAYVDKTVGVFLGRDRSNSNGDIIEGLRRLTAKRTDTDAILYNDLFERTPGYTTGGQGQAGVTVDEVINGIFNSGVALNGMFSHDAAADNDEGVGDLKIRRSLLWTDSVTGITSPNDYATFLYDPDSTTTQTQLVPRFSWHKRPSTQFYNHHRIVSFVGAADPASPTGNANTFQIGVVSRGSVSQISHDVVLFYALYTTDGSGAQNSLTFRISRWAGFYATATNEVVIAEKVIHSSGSPPSGYDIEDGTKRTMGFKVQRYVDGTTPSSAAQYTAYWDAGAGIATVTFDTFFEDATQDGTSKIVTHPAPAEATTSGRTEGVVFTSALAKDVGGTVQYTDPKFEDWTEGAMDTDPVTGGGDSVTIGGEGTPSVNLSTVAYVDWTTGVEYLRPKFEASFVSGHRYTSPQFSKARRVISARAENVDKPTFDAIVGFYDSRGGITEPFYFDFLVPTSLSDNTMERIAVCFTSSGLKTRRKQEGVYSVALEMVEVFV